MLIAVNLLGSAVDKRTRNNLYMCYVHGFISGGLSSSAVDEITRNNLIYVLSPDRSIYLGAHLARQYRDERTRNNLI